MTSGGLFQPQSCCDSVTACQRNKSDTKTMEDLSARGLEISVKNYLRGGLIRLLYLHEERKYFLELSWYNKNQLSAAGIGQFPS